MHYLKIILGDDVPLKKNSEKNDRKEKNLSGREQKVHDVGSYGP